MTLFALDRGRGDPVLLLHGFTGSSKAWPEACVEALTSRYRVLVPDLPGHGSNPVPHPGSGYDLSGTVEVHVFTGQENPFLPDYAMQQETDPTDPRITIHVVNMARARDRLRSGLKMICK